MHEGRRADKKRWLVVSCCFQWRCLVEVDCKTMRGNGGKYSFSTRMMCSVEGLAGSQRLRVKKKYQEVCREHSKHVGVYIDPWRVQSDVFVVVNSRDIPKEKRKAREQTCF